MSDDEIIAGPPGATSADARAEGDHRPKYRSWRKKYRKMKSRFDDVLRENNSLFVEEQRLEVLSKRLQEQNDQLLDLMLDLNSSLKIPHALRYDISLATDRNDYEGISIDEANHVISEAHDAVQNKSFPQTEFLRVRTALEAALAKQEVKSLAELEATVPHPTYDPERDGIPQHLADLQLGQHPAYLNSAHEEEYLLRLDAKLGDQWSLSQPRPSPPTNLASMTQRELDREIELKNPFSVHNWLKKHADKHTITDADGASDVGATPATGKRRNNLAKKVGDRAVAAAREREGSPVSSVVAKTEDDLLDDELGYVEDTPGKGKKNAGGEKDDTYRPKGGKSGSKSKRKREEGDTPSGRKKPRTSAATLVD
ncbi:hypothetical protein MBLNU459_g0681t1 [Dothideomycetes sp. NU459]